MAGRIPEDAIRHVRERASIVEVVSDTVTLRRRGRSFVGLCPFHSEKTPSFSVSEERGFYHCFGCGEHGDVFTFVMKVESLAFPDAVRRVAQRFGLRVPEAADEPARRGEPLAAANAIAAAFFQAELASPAGVRARAYVRERGLGDDVVRRFGIGWAPATGDALARHLRAKGVAVEHALEVGLLARRERTDGGNPVYDRFRDRLMFPITDRFGRVIAFGGRILPGPAVRPDAPKYLNSPESPLFHKGQTVFGLAQAREAIRRAGRAIVVEGYMDVIALAQAGVEEVVAPLGTAFTADQLRVLRLISGDTIVACFDGDRAGWKAAARSFLVFLEAGLWGRGAFLPAGEDPDSFVRAHGRAAFEACVAKAVPLVETYLDDLTGDDRDAVGRRAEAAREVARVLKRVRNPREYDILVQKTADRVGISEAILRQEGAPEAAAPVPRLGVDAARSAEELLVELMAADAAVAERVRTENVLAEFEHPTWRRVAEAFTTAAPADRAGLVATLPRELRDRVARRLLGDVADEDRGRAVADCIAKIRFRRDRRMRTRLREELSAAEARGDEAAAHAVRRRLQSLMDAEHTDKART
ncbi:MAG TPA: DNA primase [Candidatus Binatia bacterium]|jgi:DNA primase|nr:DNA primase [Candidatus Binatia bacterium]